MALINCIECKSQISTEAKICPSCGYRVKKLSVGLIIGIIFLPYIFAWFTLKKGFSNTIRGIAFGWLFIAFGGLMIGQIARQVAIVNHDDTNVESNSETSNSSENISNWQYTQKNDELRNSNTQFAYCESKNSKDFGYPYSNVKQGIGLRKDDNGFEIIIVLTEGQYSCEYDGCTINVKFDDGEIQKYKASFNLEFSGKMFIRNKKKFYNNLIKSNRVIIESDFFRHGSQTFNFDVTGLTWEHGID